MMFTMRSSVQCGRISATCGTRTRSNTAAHYPSTEPHIPVLLQQVLDGFHGRHLRVLVDCTVGAGGHSIAILSQHKEVSSYVGIDVDPSALALAESRILPATTCAERTFVRSNYRRIRPVLEGLASGSLFGAADGVLMDLGCSSMQIDDPSRGFSFLHDGPIDMRMDPQATLSAEEVVNTWPEAELARVIRDYGEEKSWRAVARRICMAREDQSISTTSQLVRAIGETHVKQRGAARKGGGRRIHPATRTFQALRIAVNDELPLLEQALPDAIASLAPGGRLAAISFHSLEDRAVKRAMARAAGRPTPEDEKLLYGADKFSVLDAMEARRVGRLVTRHPIVATEEEVAANPRSRSAKLRIFEKDPPASAA